MRTIYKYELPVTDLAVIEMPSGAQILKVDYQPGFGPAIWALVESDAQIEPRTFYVCGTGQDADDLPAEAIHLGTFLMMGGDFVWHVFGKRR